MIHCNETIQVISNKVCNDIKPTKHYEYIQFVMVHLNKLLAIIGQSKPFVNDEECAKAQELLKKLHVHWLEAKSALKLQRNMPPKYHYLHHMVELMCLFNVPIGYFDDQSVEGYNKMCNNIRRCYLNQLGILKVKYGMRKLYLITAPKYSDSYTNSTDNIS